jgi:hypothetical protein
MTGPRLWSPVLDRVKPVHIPSVCFAKHTERYLHCTESPGHTTRHYHWPTKTSWPNSGSDPQW